MKSLETTGLRFIGLNDESSGRTDFLHISRTEPSQHRLMRRCIVAVEVAAVVQTDSHIGKLVPILGVSPGCVQGAERLRAKTEAAGMPESKAVAAFMRDQLHTRIIGAETNCREIG